MVHKSSPDAETLPSSLQRGKACLRCRKRKMRCDGGKPSCQQCSRAKQGDQCEYDDGKAKTRTQMLREHVARLEQRVRELEDPSFVVAHSPRHHHERSNSSSSSSPSSNSFPSPFQSVSPLSPWESLPLVSSPLQSSVLEDEAQPPYELAVMLLDIFAPHAYQCGLDIHIGRLRASMTLPVSEQRHPVLMNAIFLWSCYLSRPGPLGDHESHYLTRTLEALSDGLQDTTKLVDLIQGTCLLSLYFLCNGRFLEGGYHLSSAASLAIQIGLHGGLSRSDIWTQFSSCPSQTVLPLAGDRFEEAERVTTFWQVYTMDRCWSVVLQKPVTIQDCESPLHSIFTPWPQRMDEFECGGDVSRGAPSRPIFEFLNGCISNAAGEFEPSSQRVKAATLLERADMISASFDPTGTLSSAAFLDEFQIMEHAIAGFVPTLIPIQQLALASDHDRLSLIVSHTLAQAAIIAMYARCSIDDTLAFDKAMTASRACVDIIKCLSDSDFLLLDPIIGPCWTCATEMFIRELDVIQASWPLVSCSDCRDDLGILFYAFKCLGARFPLLCFSASKIEARLAAL